MILLVCGGRKFDNRERLYELLDHLRPQCVVHGAAPGADTMAGEWAVSRGVPEVRVPANWSYYDGKAGPLRNAWMVEFTRADAVLAVRGETGTDDMVRLARARGLKVMDMRSVT